jgi:undecaprenyl-diphosphatase
MEWLEKIDQEIVLFINGHNHPFLDEIMWFLSDKYALIPFYFFLLYLISIRYSTKFAFQFLIIAALTILVVDQLSVYAFKEVFQRYRPSHHAELKHQLHFYTSSNGDQYFGGKFGFVSSHAANMMVLVTLTFPLFQEDKMWVNTMLIVIALFVMYSRIYLGVHYLSDILCGAFLGFSIAFFVNKYTLSKWRSS